MELQEQQAKAIVHEINQVLPQKINLMNQKGIIIASTDPDRVHTFHGGAAKIINQGLPISLAWTLRMAIVPKP